MENHSIKQFSVRHSAAIFLALVTGFIMVAPQLFFMRSMGGAYRGIYIMKTDAETHYLARMKESSEGNGAGNPFISEFKEVPTASPQITESLLAFPSSVFGISVSTLNLFYKALFPVLIFLLIYSFLLRLWGSRAWSLAGASLILMGHQVMNFYELSTLIAGGGSEISLAMYSRAVHPAVSTMIWWVYMHCAWSFWTNRFRYASVAMALILGFSFYIYLYLFTFILAMQGVLFLALLWRVEKKRAFEILFATIGGTCIGIPALLATAALMSHPLYAEFADIVGVAASRAYVVSSVGLLSVAAFFVALRLRGKSLVAGFIGVSLITSFVVVNQQIFTGFLLQQGHYHWYFNIPIFIITLLWVLQQLLVRVPRYLQMSVVVICIFFSITISSYGQVRAYQQTYDETAALQKYRPVLDWLQENTEPESVVMANDELSAYIPIYTDNNVVWEPHAAYYLVSTERRTFRPEAILRKEVPSRLFDVDYIVWDETLASFGQRDVLLPATSLVRIGEFEIVRLD